MPIVSRNHDSVLGRITVWATSGHRFDTEEVPFVERVSALVAGTFDPPACSKATAIKPRERMALPNLPRCFSLQFSPAPTLEFATELCFWRDIAILLSSPIRRGLILHRPRRPVADRTAPARSCPDSRKGLLDIEQEILTELDSASEKVGRALGRIAGAVATAPVRFDLTT